MKYNYLECLLNNITKDNKEITFFSNNLTLMTKLFHKFYVHIQKKFREWAGTKKKLSEKIIINPSEKISISNVY